MFQTAADTESAWDFYGVAGVAGRERNRVFAIYDVELARIIAGH